MTSRTLIILACLSAPGLALADEACEHAQAAPTTFGKDTVVLRGEKLATDPGVPVGDVLKDPQKFDGKAVLVQGTVRKACSRMGCWMELANDPKAAGVRVTFKDGGFFVPTDSAGAKARVQGTIQVADVSAERASHLESEGALVPRGADGKPREVQMVASGVELKR